MKKNYFLKSPFFVARLARFIAKGIDLFIVILLSFFFPPIGIILSICYMALSDSLQNGQSVGKKYMGIRVVSLEDGTPCSMYQSIVRNLPLIVPMIFSIIPFWGWIFTLGLGIPFWGLEIYLLYNLNSGNRFGDVMADTTVIASDGEQITSGQKHNRWIRGDSSQSPLHHRISII